MSEIDRGLPEWAIKQALDEINDFPTGPGGGWKWTMEEIMDTRDGALRYQAAVQIAARYIAKHEEAPVDPDEAIALEIVKSAYPEMREGYSGRRLEITLAAIKRGRELERGEVK